MKSHFKLKKLAAATVLLVGAQSAHALTPWANGAPDVTLVISGGAAQDNAYAQVINDQLDSNGGATLDVFGDATTASSTDFAARWTVYYFQGKSTLPASLANKKILIIKRSLGAAGYGVLPIISSPEVALEELDITGFTTAGSVPAEPTSTAGTVATAAGNWRVVVNSGNAATLLPLVNSDVGTLGVDAKLLLKPGSKNYPVPVARVGAGTDTFAANFTSVPAGHTQLNTGGLVYGVGVTLDLYKVLQAAQKRAGQLPATTVIGDYANEASIPSLPRNLLGSLFAGKIQTWDQVKIVDKATHAVLPLTDALITADAGVTPVANTAGHVPVAVGNRNNGAAIGAVGYATLLNYPWTAGSFAPPSTPTLNDAASEDGAEPIVKDPNGASATGRLLNDWNQASNASGLNAGLSKRWGLAINDATRNTNKSQNWRYIRVDGFAPTIKNVASGNYPLWAEGVLVYKNTQVPVGAKRDLTNALAAGLSSPTTAAGVNSAIVHDFGQTGIFAISNGSTVLPSIPYSDANPVVGFTHKNGTNVLDEIVPAVPNGVTTQQFLLQGLPQP